MLSKAPPVPLLTSGQVAEENSTNGTAATQVSPQNTGMQTAGDEIPNPEVDERVVEEPNEAPLYANPVPQVVGAARQIAAGSSSEQHQLLQNPGTRAQRPADDRLFTWAAVGLSIAIAFLLLKKFLKASEYGAVFMDWS